MKVSYWYTYLFMLIYTCIDIQAQSGFECIVPPEVSIDELPIELYDNYDMGLDCARASNKALLVYFRDSQSVNCLRMQNKVLLNHEVHLIIQNEVVMVCLNTSTTENKALPETKERAAANKKLQQEKTRINSQPLFAIFDNEENIIDLIGYCYKDEFLQFMRSGIADYKEGVFDEEFTNLPPIKEHVQSYPIDIKIELNKKRNGNYSLNFNLVAEDSIHVYSNKPGSIFPITIEFEESSMFQVVGDLKESKPIVDNNDALADNAGYHEKNFQLIQEIEIAASESFKIAGKLVYMYSNKNSVYPPVEQAFEFSIEEADIQK